MLAMAIDRGFGRGEHQWKLRIRIETRRVEFRQWRLADCLQGGRENLKLARRRAETLLSVLLISGVERREGFPSV